MNSEPTDEQLRVMVAEAMGWRWGSNALGWIDVQIYGVPPGGEAHHWAMFPNYPADLNACAEFEKAINPEQQYLYGNALADLVRKPELEAARRDGQDEDDQFPLNGFGHFHVATITARQRCLAYLKVKGKL